MPTAAEYQKLADELRQLGAVFTQAINLGDKELAMWAAGALRVLPPSQPGGRVRLPKMKRRLLPPPPSSKPGRGRLTAPP